MRRRRELPFDPIRVARDQWADRGWEKAAPGLAAVTSVMRVQQIFVAEADEILQPYQLTFARWEVLVLLSFSQNGTLAAGKISERLQVHPASVTNALKRLESSRLVLRKADPQDGRGALAQITRRGSALVERSTADLNAMLFERIGLTAEEFADLFTLLQKVRRDAGDFLD